MDAIDGTTSRAQSGRVFPKHRFAGSHLEIGEQFGEACRDLIASHLDKALGRLSERSAMSREDALEKALAYRPWIQRYAAFFDDEIQGVARGARISLGEACLLQLRAEVATPVAPDDAAECTTFAAQPEATANGIGLVGQNADLPAFYGEIAIVAEIVPDNAPRLLMLMPAGQVSYIGINDRGLGVFANFVTCDGWRLGFPRYLFSRLALTRDTVDDAITAVRGVRRASSRNLIMLDAHGIAADLETTPTSDARLDPTDGILTHANHYVSPSLLAEERSPEESVANSRARQDRMSSLLAERRGHLDAGMMEEVLRDRACYPDALCRMPGDAPGSDIITFASVIAEPSEGRMRVAVGPPNQHPYVEHRLE